VDEIHERSSESDVLLGVLKILLPLRPDLRVIIMSATIEMDQFSEYFGNCPTLEITGLNHAVEEVYLDAIMRQINMPLNKRERRDPKIWFSFITKLIVDIHKNRPPGAILVFCSGYDEIEKLYRNLRREGDPSMRVYILHSLVPVRRDRIFRRAAEGERKIVLSTNVAESSITIDDVVYVVDNGRLKVMSFNPKSRTHTLQNSLITKANAQQRKGRAGRCQEGIVFRMYPR
jgi:ATP-dependent RNA helicase DHX36